MSDRIKPNMLVRYQGAQWLVAWISTGGILKITNGSDWEIVPQTDVEPVEEELDGRAD
jgi:hypothetical protein